MVNLRARGPRLPRLSPQTRSRLWVGGAMALAMVGAAAGCGASNSERPFAVDGQAGQDPGGSMSPTSPASPSPPDAGAASPSPAVTGDAGVADGSGPAERDARADGQTGLDAGPATCAPEVPPACDAPPPDPGGTRPWRNFGSNLVAVGGDRHRGRDLFLAAEGPQWVLARFAYGALDLALVGEEVDAYLLRGCQGAWEKLGTFVTTETGSHPPTEGIEDSGGWLFWRIPDGRRLGRGRHRVHLVVAGDLTTTEVFLEVAAPRTPLFVSDVDGTLTTAETAEFGALLTGAVAEARADAAAVLRTLVDKGYRPLYLTARPAWLLARTREFLSTRGFPPGIVHTTLGVTGALGADAVRFKNQELAQLGDKDLSPAFAFGNTDTDAEAYATAGVPTERRLLYQYTDNTHGGRRLEAYADLLSELQSLPAACAP